MKILIKESKQFIYVRYIRKNANDFEKLRTQLFQVMDKNAVTTKKDIILDFVNLSFLYSPEIGVIALVARELQKISRQVIIISTDQVEKLLSNTPLQSVKNILFGIRHIKT